MAGSLIKIAETTVSTGVSSVTLTGIDSTFDVYKVVVSDIEVDTDNKFMEYRYTVSGTADSSSNYDQSLCELRADSSFDFNGFTNGNSGALDNLGTATGETGNYVLYLFNFNNSSEFSFNTLEGVARSSAGNLRSRQGGCLLRVAQVTDGISFGRFADSGTNIDKGTFTLYGLRK